MDTQRLILIVLILGLPAILFPVVIYYLRTDGFRRRVPDSLYQLSVLGKNLIISKHLVIQLGILIFLYSWLDMLLPLSLTLPIIFLVLMSLKIAKAKKVDAQLMSESSDALLKRLSAMQAEIGDIRQHIEGLGFHISSKQIELNEKEKLRNQLEKDIKLKSDEAAQWASLTEKQKQLVLDSAIKAITKESKGTFWFGLLLGFFVNILATLTWTLLGNPGKEQIIDKINNLIK